MDNAAVTILSFIVYICKSKPKFTALLVKQVERQLHSKVEPKLRKIHRIFAAYDVTVIYFNCIAAVLRN